MEVHIVHFKKEYGTFENAQNYSDGVCVIGFFGEVICENIFQYIRFFEYLIYKPYNNNRVLNILLSYQ